MDAQTITAICALAISVLATVLAAWSAHQQRRHMRLSVQPIAAVPVADFENRVGVFLANKGLGPMRIKRLSVSNRDGIVHSDVVSHMPKLELGVLWSNFHDSVDGATLEHGKRIELLVLEGDPSESSFSKSRDAVRSILKDLTVRVEYEDLYGGVLQPVEEKLSFFGRHKP